MTSAYGIDVRKGWIYTGMLDVSILSLKDSDTLNDLKQK